MARYKLHDFFRPKTWHLTWRRWSPTWPNKFEQDSRFSRKLATCILIRVARQTIGAQSSVNQSVSSQSVSQYLSHTSDYHGIYVRPLRYIQNPSCAYTSIHVSVLWVVPVYCVWTINTRCVHCCGLCWWGSQEKLGDVGYGRGDTVHFQVQVCGLFIRGGGG